MATRKNDLSYLRQRLPLQERLSGDIDMYNMEDFDKIFGVYLYCKRKKNEFVGNVSVNVFPEPIIMHISDTEVVISAPNSDLGVVLRDHDFYRIGDAYLKHRRDNPSMDALPYKMHRMLVEMLEYKLLNSPIVKMNDKEDE